MSGGLRKYKHNGETIFRDSLYEGVICLQLPVLTAERLPPSQPDLLVHVIAVNAATYNTAT